MGVDGHGQNFGLDLLAVVCLTAFLVIFSVSAAGW